MIMDVVAGQPAVPTGKVSQVLLRGGPAVAGSGVLADDAGIGDGDGEAEHPGRLGTSAVVVVEVSGDLVDAQPDRCDGGVERTSSLACTRMRKDPLSGY